MEIAATAFLSASFQFLFDKLASPELLKFASKKNVLAELQKWEGRMIAIHAVLEDAEERQQTSRFVKKWLSDLRDLAFDVEDVLDLFATKALRRKLKDESYVSTRKIRKFISAPLTKVKGDSSDFKFTVAEILPKIKEITSRLEEISNRIAVLGLKEIHGVRYSGMTESCSRITTSLVCEAKVYGRDDDKKKVLAMLKTSETTHQEFGVISIVGMGGSGKTTLAQLVFNDGSVSVDLKAWVCVGENFDVTGITKTILQKFSDGDRCNCEDLDSLQIKLKEKSKGKKFLIVLDDVWDVENTDWNLDSRWNLLRSPFEECAVGSRIIVTTRHASVSQTMGSVSTYTLPLLSKDDCLSLLAQRALQAKNFDEHPTLKDVGEEIAQRCKGLPLAAVMFGGLLVRQHRCHDKWEAVLGQWNSFKEDDGILSVLKLSYYHLPSHLKRCFAYCAVFPKDYEIEMDVLIRLWMAEGLLPQSEEEKHKMGMEYFDELLSRSIFQRSRDSSSKYVMHDLVNDLACSIAGETCFNSDILKGKKLSIDLEKVRYLSLYPSDISGSFEMIKKMKHLRAFICLDGVDAIEDALFHNLLCELRYLRALSLHILPNFIGQLKLLRYIHLFNSSMEKLPESLGNLVNLEALSLKCCWNLKELPTSIGNLKNLYCLDMHGTSVQKLPESLGVLVRLQTLMLQGCSRLKELPTSIGNLKTLCCLDITYTHCLQEMPAGIGNLLHLQGLAKFIVGKGDKLRIRELKDLSHLQGKLSIKGLHNVVDIQDAKEANLKDKSGLRLLNMSWVDDFCDGRDEKKEMEVLELLQPNEKLENLEIQFYGGTRFPSWIADPSFVKLEKLSLHDCKKIKSLPALGQLPSLKYLWIEGLEGVKAVGPEFYGDESPRFKPFQYLEILTFVGMLGWEDWISTGRGFPRLRKLRVWNCPKLVGDFPGDLPSLEEWEIVDCPSLVSFPRGNLSPNLVFLEINGCQNLTMPVSVWGLDKLSSLTALSIEGTCLPADTVSFPDDDGVLLPTSLISLQVGKVHNLESISRGLLRLTSLENLCIWDCPMLQSLPCEVLPCSLNELYVQGCKLLERKLQNERQKYQSIQIRIFSMAVPPKLLHRRPCPRHATE